MPFLTLFLLLLLESNSTVNAGNRNQDPAINIVENSPYWGELFNKAAALIENNNNNIKNHLKETRNAEISSAILHLYAKNKLSQKRNPEFNDYNDDADNLYGYKYNRPY